MTGIFLQARLQSKRLPQKALLPLINGNVIQHAMRALKEVKADIYALLTDKKSSTDLRVYTQKEGFQLFEGPEDDVLSRFLMAARFFDVDRIIRATGDNPLVSPVLASEICALHQKKGVDLSHFVDMPLGLGVEVVETSALVRADNETDDPFEREHCTTHLYRNQDKYTILNAPCPDDCRLPDIHVSIDTQKDYDLIMEIYKDLYHGIPIEAGMVVQWLKDNEELFLQSKGT